MSNRRLSIAISCCFTLTGCERGANAVDEPILHPAERFRPSFAVASRIVSIDGTVAGKTLTTSHLNPVSVVSADGSNLAKTFGRIEDVAVDKHGRILVLDSRTAEIRVLAGNGQFIGSLGRPAGGTAIIRSPRAMAIANDGTVFVADFPSRIHVFEPTSTFYRYSGHTPLPYDPADICVLGSHVYVNGVKYGATEAVHQYTRSLTYVRSFGTTYESKDDLVNWQVGRGHIACLEQDKTIVLTPGPVLGEVLAYDANGELKWRTLLKGFVPLEVLEWKSQVQFRSPNTGFHRVERLTALASGFLLQLAFVEPNVWSGGGYSQLYTLRFDHFGIGKVVSNVLPPIGAVGDHLMVGLRNDSVPRLFTGPPMNSTIEGLNK